MIHQSLSSMHMLFTLTQSYAYSHMIMSKVPLSLMYRLSSHEFRQTFWICMVFKIWFLVRKHLNLAVSSVLFLYFSAVRNRSWRTYFRAYVFGIPFNSNSVEAVYTSPLGCLIMIPPFSVIILSRYILSDACTVSVATYMLKILWAQCVSCVAVCQFYSLCGRHRAISQQNTSMSNINFHHYSCWVTTER